MVGSIANSPKPLRQIIRELAAVLRQWPQLTIAMAVANLDECIEDLKLLRNSLCEQDKR